MLASAVDRRDRAGAGCRGHVRARVSRPCTGGSLAGRTRQWRRRGIVPKASCTSMSPTSLPHASTPFHIPQPASQFKAQAGEKHCAPERYASRTVAHPEGPRRLSVALRTDHSMLVVTRKCCPAPSFVRRPRSASLLPPIVHHHSGCYVFPHASSTHYHDASTHLSLRDPFFHLDTVWGVYRSHVGAAVSRTGR